MNNYIPIRHLRGSAAEWEAADAVVKDGELALLQCENGRTRIKVGNGTATFSELPFLDGNVRQENISEVFAGFADDLRLGTRASLTLSVPAAPDDDYYAILTFESGETATVFTNQSDICFSGDDVTGGAFFPAENKHYTVFLWYDGEMQGLVRGVSRA